MNKNIGSIIDGLKGNVSTQYGALYESKSVVADTVDAAIKDTKKDNIKMDDLDGIPVEEIDNTENITADDIKDEDNKDATANTQEPKNVVEATVDEDEWKTMHGAHILVDDKGGIKAGGPKELRKDSEKGSEKKDKKSDSTKKEIKHDLKGKKSIYQHLEGPTIDFSKSPDSQKLSDDDKEDIEMGLDHVLMSVEDPERFREAFDAGDDIPVLKYKGKKVTSSRGIRFAFSRCKTVGDLREVIKDLSED